MRDVRNTAQYNAIQYNNTDNHDLNMKTYNLVNTFMAASKQNIRIGIIMGDLMAERL